MLREKLKQAKPVSLLTLAAILVVLIALMSAYSIFSGSAGGLTWTFFYYGKYAFMIPLIVLAFFNRKISRSEKKAAILIGLLVSVPIFLQGIWSVFLWLHNGTEFPYISRGISNLLFTLIAAIGGVAVGMLFKSKAPALLAWSCVAVYALAILMGIASNEPGWIKALNPLANRSSTDYVELHEVAYVLGMLVLYFVLMNRERTTPHRTLLCVLCLVFFVIAGKRIGYLALLFCLVYGLIEKKAPRKIKRVLLRIGEVCAIVLCFLYIVITMSDDLITILNDLGISSMGRNIIFNYFRQFGSLDPGFLGNGAGFVSRQFDYTTAAELYNMASIKALHNDLFKMFLEMGTIGCIVWLVFWNGYIPEKVSRKAGLRAGTNCAILIFYSMITYMTDNTAGYFMYQAVLSCLLFLNAWNGIRAREAKQSILAQSLAAEELSAASKSAASDSADESQTPSSAFRRGRIPGRQKQEVPA